MPAKNMDLTPWNIREGTGRVLVHFSADQLDLADTRRPKTWT